MYIPTTPSLLFRRVPILPVIGVPHGPPRGLQAPPHLVSAHLILHDSAQVSITSAGRPLLTTAV